MKILKAWWYTQSSVGVIFDKNLSEIPELVVETDGANMPLKSRIASPREFAEYSSYYIKNDTVHFFLTRQNFFNVSRHGMRSYYVCGNFNGWGEAIGKKEWKMRPSEKEYEYELTVPLSLLGDRRKKFLFKFATSEGIWLHPRPDSPNIEYDHGGNANLRFIADRSYEHFLIGECAFPSDLREPAFLYCPKSFQRVPIGAAELLLELNYNVKMGAHVSGGKTHFALFAPRADLVKVLIRQAPDSQPVEYPLSTKDGALWTETFNGDWSGKFYSYRVFGRNISSSTAFDSSREIVDPYALLLVNRKGPALIVNQRDLPHARAGFVPPSWHDLLIAEVHVRDVLANAPSYISESERMGFRGLAKWLKTGDCYLEKLGVNAVELQPVQEFDNASYGDYHWGYMPVNWFAPSSAYAHDPRHLTQAKDFADMVDAFHSRNLAVILDVVYNHTGEPNHLLGIDKEYYFETNADNQLLNYSGCGNDFRARPPMSKKLIIESLKHFLTVYKVDGFRFDLAELLGADVLSEIEVELKKINPAVILIAEPWSFRGNIADALKDTGFTYWNDGFREFMLKFAMNNGNFDGFKYYISGSQSSYASWPAQTVNYVESHDDMCLLDRISNTPYNPTVAEEKVYKMCLALTLTSIGIPMLAEGADLFRTKNGVGNTYLRGDLNALNYLRGEEFSGVCEWVRNFCKFRTSRSANSLKLLRRYSNSYMRYYHSPDGAAAALFNANKELKSPQIFAAFNPSARPSNLTTDNLNLSNFIQIADIDRFESGGLKYPMRYAHGSMVLPAHSFALFLEKRSLA